MKGDKAAAVAKSSPEWRSWRETNEGRQGGSGITTIWQFLGSASKPVILRSKNPYSFQLSGEKHFEAQKSRKSKLDTSMLPLLIAWQIPFAVHVKFIQHLGRKASSSLSHKPFPIEQPPDQPKISWSKRHPVRDPCRLLGHKPCAVVSDGSKAFRKSLESNSWAKGQSYVGSFWLLDSLKYTKYTLHVYRSTVYQHAFGIPSFMLHCRKAWEEKCLGTLSERARLYQQPARLTPSRRRIHLD